MTTFKKIINCIRSGGLVQEFSTQMEVVAYVDTMTEKAVYLGLERQIYLKVLALDLDDEEWFFTYCEAGEW